MRTIYILIKIQIVLMYIFSFFDWTESWIHVFNTLLWTPAFSAIIFLKGYKNDRTKEKSKVQDQLAKLDAAECNTIEKKLGVGKRHYGMGFISVLLQKTSEAVFAMQFLVMNMECRLASFFIIFLNDFLEFQLNKNGLFENRSAVHKYVSKVSSLGN